MFELKENGHLDHENGAEETEVSRFGIGFRMAALGVLLTVFAGACDKADISTVSALKAQLNNMKAKVSELEKKHGEEVEKARTAAGNASATDIAGAVCAEKIEAARVQLAGEATKAIADAIAREKQPCGVLDRTSTELAVYAAVEKVFGADSNELVLKSLINDVLVMFIDNTSDSDGFEHGLLQDPKMKSIMLSLLKANPDKLDAYVLKMISVIAALPNAKRIDVAKSFAKLSTEVMGGMALYSKFGGVVDHHDKYLDETGYSAISGAVEAKGEALQNALDSATDENKAAAKKALDDFDALDDQQKRNAVVVKPSCSDSADLHGEYENLSEIQKTTLRMLSDLAKNGIGFAKVAEVISSAVKALVQ